MHRHDDIKIMIPYHELQFYHYGYKILYPWLIQFIPHRYTISFLSWNLLPKRNSQILTHQATAE